MHHHGFTLPKWLPGAAPWWLSEQVAILCLVFKWLIHPTNWLVSFICKKVERKISKIMGSPMTCWCGFGGGVGRWWKSPVRIIASKLEVLGEKQTWKGTNQILQHSCFPSEFWVQRKTPVFEAKKGNLKRSIYIHSSVIVYTNWGVQ